MDKENKDKKTLRMSKGILLDVRTAEEYCTGHIQGAILIETPHPPLSHRDRFRLHQKLSCLMSLSDPHSTIYVYCKKGIRAKRAKQLLESMGFPSVISLGGVTEPPLSLVFQNPSVFGVHIETCDFGQGSAHFNIEDATEENKMFRHVLSTPGKLQVVVMSLLPGEEIGMERHGSVDQFIRVEKGSGLAEIYAPSSHMKVPLVSGDALVIRHGDWHNVINTGSERLQLYTIYAPPNHKPHVVQLTKQDKE